MRHLENQRFGRLLVIERVSGKTWRCLCDCGNEKFVSTFCLTSGMTRSCGCLQNESRSIDITGQSFGRLVTIEPTGKIRDNSAILKFKCDCGNECETTVQSVKWGGRKSCGCLQHEAKIQQALKLNIITHLFYLERRPAEFDMGIKKRTAYFSSPFRY